MSSYLSHKSNSTLCALIATLQLQIEIFNPMGKIVQNVKFSHASQNNDLISNWIILVKTSSKGMFSFQDKSPEAYKLKLYTK